MFALVIGAASSGKSSFAEDLILHSPGNPRLYLACMEPFGEEGRRRVERHRSLRAGKGFQTLERYVDLRHLPVPAGCALLLEDLGNLTANERFRPDGAGPDTEEAVWQGICHLRRQAETLVIVSPEVFSGGSDWQGDTLDWLRVLGSLHCRLAKEADKVIEVVCGQSLYWKGGSP